MDEWYCVLELQADNFFSRVGHFLRFLALCNDQRDSANVYMNFRQCPGIGLHNYGLIKGNVASVGCPSFFKKKKTIASIASIAYLWKVEMMKDVYLYLRSHFELLHWEILSFGPFSLYLLRKQFRGGGVGGCQTRLPCRSSSPPWFCNMIEGQPRFSYDALSGESFDALID